MVLVGFGVVVFLFVLLVLLKLRRQGMPVRRAVWYATGVVFGGAVAYLVSYMILHGWRDFLRWAIG